MNTQVNNTDYQHRRVRVLLFFLAGYLCTNLIFRWLRYTLFSSWGFGWEKPTVLETSYQVFSVCLVPVVWAFIAYLLACAIPRVINHVTLALITFSSVLVIELDMSWYYLSKVHITARDIHMFLTEPWKEHFGIQDYDVIRFGLLLSVHGLAISGLLLLASILSSRPLFARLRSPRLTFLGVVLVMMLIADGLVVGRYVENDRRQWIVLAYQNPLRVGPMDRLWSRFSGTQSDLESANRALTAVLAENQTPRNVLPGAAKPGSVSTRRAQGLDVIIVAVEGFNRRLVNTETMPFFSALAASGVVSENHYSTGNSTHYGILGLIFGAPPVFYRGDVLEGIATSRYVNLFTRNGYRSSQFSTDLVAHRHTGKYLANFTEPVIEVKDPRKLLTAAEEELKRSGRHFLFFYYGGTHYPYLHRSENQWFQPETPEGFDFSRGDLYSYRDQIANRYKNCLRELDEWLQALVALVKRDKTIVVITGDHGEEMFEEGRLSHSSSLGEPQIRTPLVVHIPGLSGRQITRVTGHHDVMPTLIDVLGWRVDFEERGRSILDPSAKSAAIIAYNNHTNPPKRWAVITGDLKSILTGAAGERLQIEGLRSREEDRNMLYRDAPKEWGANLMEVARLQYDLDRAIKPGLPSGRTPGLSPWRRALRGRDMRDRLLGP